MNKYERALASAAPTEWAEYQEAIGQVAKIKDELEATIEDARRMADAYEEEADAVEKEVRGILEQMMREHPDAFGAFRAAIRAITEEKLTASARLKHELRYDLEISSRFEKWPYAWQGQPDRAHFARSHGKLPDILNAAADEVKRLHDALRDANAILSDGVDPDLYARYIERRDEMVSLRKKMRDQREKEYQAIDLLTCDKERMALSNAAHHEYERWWHRKAEEKEESE